MGRQQNPHIGGTQLPLITPRSGWEVPRELPDLRGRVRRVALDTEGSDEGLSAGRGSGWPHRAGYISGVSVAWDGGTIYAPVRHPDTDNLDGGQVRQWLLDLLCSGVRVVMHHAQHDLGWLLAEWGIHPPVGGVDDTECMAVMVDENRLSYQLGDLCRWRGVPGKDEVALREAAAAYGYAKSPKANIARLPARYVGPYAEQDAAALLPLAAGLDQEIDAQEMRAAYQLEMDLVPMVLEMRRRGIRVDLEAAARGRDGLRVKRDVVLKDLSERAGRRLGMDDIRSPRTLEQLFVAERLPFQRTSKTNQGSFEATWMRKHPHWLPRLVSRAKQLEDAASKFLQGFLLDYASRGRIHASINQYRGEEGGTRSSRFSYSDPPLQQAPERDEELGPMFRGCLLPEEGEEWHAPDYCYDDRTEVLTEVGWRLFRDLSGERVAQWDQGEVSFVAPTSRYIGPPRQRRMVHVQGPRQLDFCVTEDHHCLLMSQDSPRPEVVPAHQLGGCLHRKKVPQAGVLPGFSQVPDELVQLAVALQADASDRREFGWAGWVFHLKLPRKIDRLRRLLQGLGIAFRQTVLPDGRTRISFRHHSPLDSLLGPGKLFQLGALLELTPRLRDIFLDELIFWDGTHKNYDTTSLENANTVQAVAVVSGRRAPLRRLKPWASQWGRRPLYTVSLAQKAGTWGTRQMKVVEEDYTGPVYCVTVPSGFIITRRCGHVVVSSNSQQEYRLIVHFAAAMGYPSALAAARKYQADPRTDFHAMVAEMTGLERKPAKDSNFAKAFGAGVGKFASMIGKSIEEAQAIYDQYDREMPFVRQLAEACASLAERRGYIRLLDGARSHFDMFELAWHEKGEAYAPPRPEAQAREFWKGRRIRRSFTHKAMNRLIQGSAARQMKAAMRACWQEGLVPLIQMHDELGFSFGDRALGYRAAELMREVYQLGVPMVVDLEVGPSWGAVRKI